MHKKRTVSIINFIRYDEPRLVVDLFEPVREQMKLSIKYDLPTTWLMQVDAILAGPYPEFFKANMPKNHELGLWLEINRMHCDYAGVKYRGRDGVNWDHHSQAALTIGYSVGDRIKLADAAMEIFKEKFTCYPESVAAWYIDAVTLAHLYDKYGIKASANCRDQWGTDGYSLWGGVWAGGYYPSRKNAMIPGSCCQSQIKVPVFRMLGSCPINQYDCAIGENGQEVFTLEPAYNQNRKWVEKLFANMFDEVPFDYSFVQAGQENSFGWTRMRESYQIQMLLINEYRNDNRISVTLLKDAGEWYQKQYSLTTPVGVIASQDPTDKERQAFWYNSRYYRVGFVREDMSMKIRDLHLFTDEYESRYLNSQCNSAAMTVDALPIVEGFLWQKYFKNACLNIELFCNGKWREARFDKVETDCDNETMRLKLYSKSGACVWELREDKIKCTFPIAIEWRLRMPFPAFAGCQIKDSKIEFAHNGFKYNIKISEISTVIEIDNHIILSPQKHCITFELHPQYQET